MKCNACGIEIPPVWVNALKTNICPSCGKNIMDSELQELIDGLSQAIEKMPNNVHGIACWLVSVYKLQKIADYDPPEFREAKPAANINMYATNSQKQKKVEDFFERAGVDISGIPELSSKKTGKKVPPQIKQIEEQEERIVEEDDNTENLNNLDETDRMILEGTSGSTLSEEEKNEIARTVQNARFGAIEQNPIIAAAMEAQKQRQENIANGVGAVSRSGKPAGFRRSE